MPQALTDLIGRKLLFKISIGPDNKQGSNSAYVVDLVVDDAAMIEEFEAQPIPQVIPYILIEKHLKRCNFNFVIIKQDILLMCQSIS